MNELVKPRTMDHLIEKTVPIDWLLFVRKVYSGCPEVHVWEKFWSVIEDTSTQLQKCFLGGMRVTFFTIMSSCVVRFPSFIYQTNCVCTGFQLVLDTLTYVAPSSDKHTN